LLTRLGVWTSDRLIRSSSNMLTAETSQLGKEHDRWFIGYALW